MATVVHADEHALGRLFFTSDQRIALERQRYARPAAAEPRPAAEGTVSVDGVVRRSSGKNTVWVNGEPYSDRPSARYPRPSVGAKDPALVTLHSANGRSASLRVGEAAEVETGAVRQQPSTATRPAPESAAPKP